MIWCWAPGRGYFSVNLTAPETERFIFPLWVQNPEFSKGNSLYFYNKFAVKQGMLEIIKILWYN